MIIKFALLMLVAMTANAQVPAHTPLYTRDLSGIDHSPMGDIIRGVSGSDNKSALKDKIIQRLNEERIHASQAPEAAFANLGFHCAGRKCEYSAVYGSKVMADNWMQSARTTYLITVPDAGIREHIEINITKSNMDPRHLGPGKLSDFLSQWPPYKNESEIMGPLRVFINESLSSGERTEQLKLLGFNCNDQCSFAGYLVLHHASGYKFTDEYYNYDIKTSLDGRDISAVVKLTKNRE
jgi:hypothetical protein